MTRATNETCTDILSGKFSIISVESEAHFIKNPQSRLSESTAFDGSVFLRRDEQVQCSPTLVQLVQLVVLGYDSQTVPLGYRTQIRLT